MHNLEAIIAREDVTRDIESRFVFARSILLSQGFAMVPLTNALKDDIDDLVGSETIAYDCFEKLSGSICEIIQETNQPYEIAYVETKYFGGEGEQSAIVWINGKVVYGPLSSKSTPDPINEALKIIGVLIIQKQDEFNEIKLGWNRDTEKWYESNS